jgi:hypothetical protein
VCGNQAVDSCMRTHNPNDGPDQMCTGNRTNRWTWAADTRLNSPNGQKRWAERARHFFAPPPSCLGPEPAMPSAEIIQRYSPNKTGMEHTAMSGAHVAVAPYTTRARSPRQPRQIRVPFHEAAVQFGKRPRRGVVLGDNNASGGCAGREEEEEE